MPKGAKKAKNELMTIGVVGAGAMGTGIAQVAAAAGHEVVLGDSIDGATSKAKAAIARALDRDVDKRKLSQSDADAILERITFHPRTLDDNIVTYQGCGLVIEAIVENLPAKKKLFESLERVVDLEATLASNTSSLSITAIASA